MFEFFTEKAIKVILYAQEEARRLGHNFVGTEMILLGLLDENTGLGAQALKSMEVNLNDTRIEVEKIIGRGSGYVEVANDTCIDLEKVIEKIMGSSHDEDAMPFTARTKRLLELAWDEARLTQCNYIGTEHLLLGLIREGNGVAARVLIDKGVDLSALRTKVLDLLEAGLQDWKAKQNRQTEA